MKLIFVSAKLVGWEENHSLCSQIGLCVFILFHILIIPFFFSLAEAIAHSITAGDEPQSHQQIRKKVTFSLPIYSQI